MARQRRSGWAWWAVEHGGAPRWLFALLVLVLAGVGVLWIATSAQRSASTASSGTPTPAVETTAPAATPMPMPMPTPTAEPFDISVIGDSYTSGSAANTGPVWPQLTGIPNINVLALPDIGYAAENPDAPGATFVTQADQVPADTDLVVFFGSRNDPADYDAVYEAASAAYAAALARAPQAALLVIGPSWGEDEPTEEESSIRDAVRDAATAAGARWVDPVAEVWFPPDSGLIGDDGVNPNDAGQQWLAERISPLLAPA